jgi:hypothetical protein
MRHCVEEEFAGKEKFIVLNLNAVDEGQKAAQ